MDDRTRTMDEGSRGVSRDEPGGIRLFAAGAAVGSRFEIRSVRRTGGAEGVVDRGSEFCGRRRGDGGVVAHGAAGRSCSPRPWQLAPYEMIMRSVIHSTGQRSSVPVSYPHLRAHETLLDIVCRFLLAKKNTCTPRLLLH